MSKNDGDNINDSFQSQNIKDTKVSDIEEIQRNKLIKKKKSLIFLSERTKTKMLEKEDGSGTTKNLSIYDPDEELENKLTEGRDFIANTPDEEIGSIVKDNSLIKESSTNVERSEKQKSLETQIQNISIEEINLKEIKEKEIEEDINNKSKLYFNL